MKKFENKNIIITGSSYGIGKGIALGFAKEGGNVVINYPFEKDKTVAMETVEELKHYGTKVIAVQANVAEGGDVKSLIETSISEFGKIDVLVNNAGTNGKIAPITEFTEADYDHIMNINIKGVFLCVINILPHFIKNGKGRIINMGSIDSFVGDENFSVYVASKGAIAAFTRTLSLELGPKNITVNAICPGFVDTPSADIIEKQYPGTKEYMAKRIPMGRLLKPSDIANLALFLAADESEMINGSCILIDGGLINNVS